MTVVVRLYMHGEMRMRRKDPVLEAGVGRPGTEELLFLSTRDCFLIGPTSTEDTCQE
jgi:hypothetical protein